MATKTIGIIKEGKQPQDNRVPFTPTQCKALLEKHPNLSIKVQPSPHRSYTDEEYRQAGIHLTEDLSDCDILFGVKEVPTEQLLPNKTYFFFSHTIKEQPYNRGLLQHILANDITLIDYECLTWDNGIRIVGFGRFAGIVGAHNGILAWGKRSNAFDLQPAHTCRDYQAIKTIYRSLSLPPMKIALTGSGRVAKGSKEVLDALSIRQVDKHTFLQQQFDEAVYVLLDTMDLYEHNDGNEAGSLEDFFQHPQNYHSLFEPYTHETDLMINAIYWDPAAPIYFSKAEMQQPDFRIKVIADITCDIEGSIPATHKATTIADPVFGYNPSTQTETAPYQDNTIDIMSVDNLPNELPRDASESFGHELSQHIIPALLEANSPMLQRATIARAGQLTQPYAYLQDYVDGVPSE